MAQPHALSGQIVNVRPLGAQLRQASSTAILKAGQLEVMRIVLLAGKSMPEHMTRGEATVQCIEGEVEFQGSNGTYDREENRVVVEKGYMTTRHAVAKVP